MNPVVFLFRLLFFFCDAFITVLEVHICLLLTLKEKMVVDLSWAGGVIQQWRTLLVQLIRLHNRDNCRCFQKASLMSKKYIYIYFIWHNLKGKINFCVEIWGRLVRMEIPHWSICLNNSGFVTNGKPLTKLPVSIFFLSYLLLEFLNATNNRKTIWFVFGLLLGGNEVFFWPPWNSSAGVSWGSEVDSWVGNRSVFYRRLKKVCGDVDKENVNTSNKHVTAALMDGYGLFAGGKWTNLYRAHTKF